MQDDSIFLPEPTPTPEKPRCRALAKLIALALRFGAWIVATAVWFQSNWFYAIAGLGIGYIAISIVRSKLRQMAIPPRQLEYSYTDDAIANWYVVRTLLCDI